MFARLLAVAAIALSLTSSASAALITNGDFEAGNTGFTSGYANTTVMNGLLAESTYAVGSNPNFFHPGFPMAAGFTSPPGGPSGNMLIVNGATAANIVVWASNVVNIQANMDYTFSFFAANLVDGSPATLQVSASGFTFAPVNLTGLPVGQWTLFSFTQNSGAFSGPATFSIVDTNTAAGGNDFALDNISLTAVPEPATLAVFGLMGLAGAGYVRRRKAALVA